MKNNTIFVQYFFALTDWHEYSKWQQKFVVLNVLAYRLIRKQLKEIIFADCVGNVSFEILQKILKVIND